MKTIIIRFILIRIALGAFDVWAGESLTSSSTVPTRPVYRPKPQTVVAVDFSGDDNLEPQKKIEAREKFSVARQPSLAAPIDKDFGTALDRSAELEVVASEAKSRVPLKNVELNKTIRQIKFQSEQSLDDDYQ